MNKEIGNVAGVSIMVNPETYEDIKKRKIIYENEILIELQQRIDKAIEYIMTELITEWDIENGGCVSGSDLPVYAITPLLDILRGE